MTESTHRPDPFTVKDCALIAQGTGISAQNLREFREGLRTVEPASIYHHFWGRLLQPQFDEPEYNNDFASWAHRALHEKALAERLSAVDPAGFKTIEDVRSELIEVVEGLLDESDLVPWARADQQFHFLRSQVVVFDTGRRVEKPEDLPAMMAELSAGSLFYHFIDARRRTEDGRDDFCTWLAGAAEGHQALIARLESVDPYFSSLSETQALVVEILSRFFSGDQSA
jgi:hypothetical protein